MSETPPASSSPSPSTRRGPLLVVGAVALAIVVLGVLALAGVFSGHDVDEAAWRQSVEQQVGHPVEDWPKYRDVWLDECDEDDSAFGYFVAAGLDAGTDPDLIRSNVRYACPDRLEDVEAVVGNGRDMDAVCAKSPDERTEDEQMLAEAMGC